MLFETKMKISFFAFGEPFPNRHASYTHITEKMKAVAAMGNEVNVFARAPDGSRPIGSVLEQTRNYSVSYVDFPKFGKIQNPVNFWKSKGFVVNQSAAADLIHERFYAETFSTGIAKKLGKPYIIEMNNPVAEEISNPVLRHFVRRIRSAKLKACDAIITQTSTLKEIISSFTEKPVYVVPNGVNNSYFSKKVKPGKGITVTFVGAFRPWHGINQIPEIMDRVLKENENVRFVFIGGTKKDIDRNLKLPPRLKEKTEVLGELAFPEVVKHLLASDILIAPFDTSRYTYLEEYGFWWCPVKLFEYLAAGKPVVSYDFDEVKNIVKNAALLAEPGDVGAFADNISRLVENKALRQKLGANAKKLARSYDWKVRAKQTVSVYKDFI